MKTETLTDKMISRNRLHTLYLLIKEQKKHTQHLKAYTDKKASFMNCDLRKRNKIYIKKICKCANEADETEVEIASTPNE